jgi:hypothetical protein
MAPLNPTGKGLVRWRLFLNQLVVDSSLRTKSILYLNQKRHKTYLVLNMKTTSRIIFIRLLRLRIRIYNAAPTLKQQKFIKVLKLYILFFMITMVEIGIKVTNCITQCNFLSICCTSVLWPEPHCAPVPAPSKGCCSLCSDYDNTDTKLRKKIQHFS